MSRTFFHTDFNQVMLQREFILLQITLRGQIHHQSKFLQRPNISYHTHTDFDKQLMLQYEFNEVVSKKAQSTAKQ